VILLAYVVDADDPFVLRINGYHPAKVAKMKKGVLDDSYVNR